MKDIKVALCGWTGTILRNLPLILTVAALGLLLAGCGGEHHHHH